MSTSLVSVLMPAYNAERYVGEAVESVLAQTYPHVKVVVVNDGSTDGTREALRPFEARGVRVVEQANAGQTGALNRALAEMHPDTAFVQYLDADDTIASDKIAVQVRRLLAEPARTLATCAWARFYDDAPESAVFTPFNDYHDYDDPVGWLIDDWTGQGTMPPGAWLYPRSVVDAVGPWNEALTLNNDMEYFTRAVLASDKIAFCGDARLFYRSGHENLSGRRDAEALASQKEVIRLSTDRLLACEDSPRTRRAAACYWQYLAHMAYPDDPLLTREAEAQAGRLGGGTLVPRGGRLFNTVNRVAGWKAATQAQRLADRARHSIRR